MELTAAARKSPDEMRAEALSVARALLVEGGPDQVKARILAVRLGVSVGTIYNLFGDLDELFFHLNGQVYDELSDSARRELEAAKAKNADGVGEMLALARGYLRFVTSNQGLWAGVLAFNQRSKSRVPDWYRGKELALFQMIDQAILHLPGARASSISKTAGRALWASVNGIVTVSVGRDGLVAVEEEVWEQIELVVTAVADRLAATSS